MWWWWRGGVRWGSNEDWGEGRAGYRGGREGRDEGNGGVAGEAGLGDVLAMRAVVEAGWEVACRGRLGLARHL